MSRLPQLEQELVTAAARRRGPRRAIRPAARAALAASVVALIVAGVLITIGEGDGQDTRPGTTAPFPPGRTLEAPGVPPRPAYRPLEGTLSEPLTFSGAGTHYTAVGFQARNDTICASLADADSGPPAGLSCFGVRLLRKELKRRPAHLFAAGGTEQGTMSYSGFARGTVTALEVREPARGATIVLSPPWRPWRGPPIRFFFVFTDGSDPQRMPQVEVP